VKIVWGPEYRSVTVPAFFQGSRRSSGCRSRGTTSSFSSSGRASRSSSGSSSTDEPGKIARAAAVDGEMVGAVGSTRVDLRVHLRARLLSRRPGRALIARWSTSPRHGPFADHGDVPHRHHRRPREMWGALLGSLIFGLTQSLGILVWPQFGIAFPTSPSSPSSSSGREGS